MPKANRFNSRDELKPGTLVVFNDLPDATVFQVTGKRGLLYVTVREAGTNHAEQTVDYSTCLKPTREQLNPKAEEL